MSALPVATFYRFRDSTWGVYIKPCPVNLKRGDAVSVQRRAKEPVEVTLGAKLWQTRTGDAVFALGETNPPGAGSATPPWLRSVWDELDAKYGRGQKKLDNAV